LAFRYQTHSWGATSPKILKLRRFIDAFSDHYGCREHTVLQRDLERIVLASVELKLAVL
jgi:hypothetical protein